VKAYGLCVLIEEVALQTIDGPEGEVKVLNNRVVSYVSKDKKHYIDITAWGKTALMIAENFKKGDEIFIEGTLSNQPINPAKFGNLSDSVITVESIAFTHGRRSKLGGGGL